MSLDTEQTRTRNRLRMLLLGKFSVGRIVRSVLFIYLAIGVYAFFFADRQIF
ncbi:MAG TPA: hypothetical protein V6C98_06135 [Thermosynechococcaceae cyanobacterium]